MHLVSLFRLSVPLILLACALLFRGEIQTLEPAYRKLLAGAPYLTLGAALALSIFYNRARKFAIALTLLLAYWLIATQLQATLALTPRAFLVYSLLSVVLPALLLILLLVPERGAFNRYGIFVAMLPLLFLLAGGLLLHYFPQALAGLTKAMPILPYPGYYLSHIASGFFAAGFLAALFLLLRRNSEHAAAMFAALLFVFITLAFFNLRFISVLMFGIAGISLMISLIRGGYDMAYRDELTGLYGRRALNEKLDSLGRRYVIAMLDVDHFKKFNDTYGHDVGDEVLKMVAARIARIKGGGSAYRYGGEEFCIVFPGKRLELCLPYLESVRLAVEDYSLVLRDKQTRPDSTRQGRRQRAGRGGPRTVSVTISIGVAERDERFNEPQDVIKAADAALYKAKKKGRNCLAY